MFLSLSLALLLLLREGFGGFRERERARDADGDGRKEGRKGVDGTRPAAAAPPPLVLGRNGFFIRRVLL